jgi:DNA-directed RNA polymerase specialized sigma24 family protein
MPITPADEQRLQAVFEWAKRLFRRKGLTEHDAEDCAAEVRLRRRSLTSSKDEPSRSPMQCRSRAACWQISYPRSSDIPQPFRWKTPIGTGGGEPSLEQRAAVRWALEQLPPDARALVWLHDVEGYTAEELTARFGCPTDCLRQRLHRARKRLRELLE